MSSFPEIYIDPKLHIEHEQHFFVHCQGYNTIRRELYSRILNADAHFANLNDKERTKYLLRADSKATAHKLVLDVSVVDKWVPRLVIRYPHHVDRSSKYPACHI